MLFPLFAVRRIVPPGMPEGLQGPCQFQQVFDSKSFVIIFLEYMAKFTAPNRKIRQYSVADDAIPTRMLGLVKPHIGTVETFGERFTNMNPGQAGRKGNLADRPVGLT